MGSNLLTAQGTLDKSRYEPGMAFEVVRKTFGYSASKNYFTCVSCWYFLKLNTNIKERNV